MPPLLAHGTPQTSNRQPQSPVLSLLDMRIVRLGRKAFHSCELDGVGFSRTLGLAAQLHGLALLLGFAAAFGVGFDSGQDCMKPPC